MSRSKLLSISLCLATGLSGALMVSPLPKEARKLAPYSTLLLGAIAALACKEEKQAWRIERIAEEARVAGMGDLIARSYSGSAQISVFQPQSGLGQVEGAIVEAYAHHNLNLIWLESQKGSAFDRFLFKSESGTIAQIRSRAEDVQSVLGLANAPIISPSSKGIAIDIEKRDRVPLKWESVIPPHPPSKSGFWLPIGVDIEGNLHSVDLSNSDTCHILIGGRSGGGKSKLFLSAIAALAKWYSPQEYRLILIDPKKVEFSGFAPLAVEGQVWTSAAEAKAVLRGLIEEMGAREDAIAGQARDLDEYNALPGIIPIPHVLVCIDELATIIDAIAPELSELSRRARATGIHLMAATQKPSVKAIPSEITANFGALIAFRTRTQKEGQVILGASHPTHQLLGKGDCVADIKGIKRLQVPFLAKPPIFSIPIPSKSRTDPRTVDFLERCLESGEPSQGSEDNPVTERVSDENNLGSFGGAISERTLKNPKLTLEEIERTEVGYCQKKICRKTDLINFVWVREDGSKLTRGENELWQIAEKKICKLAIAIGVEPKDCKWLRFYLDSLDRK